MTTIFLEKNDESYLLEHLTYDSEIKMCKMLTEKVGDWKKVTFKCPEESEQHSFKKNFHFNPPPEQMESTNQIFV